ncbi:class I SAM-dependent methyltransferase [Aspergillus vadensis CBS 113365]|uniref:S-adenosyl-L-methionine-dependent methyltransferase n=1 Tax=Aspergillus vadensis (strain CBS 113365 / IMI 142717 / IBT 24658) TaxID=1448311 RepID=A0A319C840_ASPVC|nr:S-adenosyl-L-methionine-dependent methyltransferase [Aspergillus vadensis CBS 113365]PYH74613.1 S-adenosyl-L-methionine-dependent methyltransferase [Aspergillus vadensis CBS 113365]
MATSVHALGTKLMEQTGRPFVPIEATSNSAEWQTTFHVSPLRSPAERLTFLPSTRSPDSQTENLDETYRHTITVHGREYQQYSIDNEISFQPVDRDEANRLELQNKVFNKIFDSRLIFPRNCEPQRVLDCGHGAGSWAIQVAEEFPECEVIGVDISPHMIPDDDDEDFDVAENLEFQVDDLNRPFTFPPKYFDLVNSRMMATGIDGSRWSSYIQDIKRVLKPGGWVQLVEIYFNVQSDNGSLTEKHALRQWSTKLMSSVEDVKDLRVGTRLRDLLLAAGLKEVESTMIPVPLCEWSSVEPRMRDIGKATRKITRHLLTAVALYPLTQRLHMSHDEFQQLIDQAQKEAENPSLKTYFPLYVAIGRKPL